MSEIENALKKKVTQTTSFSTEQKANKKPPKGAIIIEQTIRTETEQIENGYLTIKSWDGRYKIKDSDDSYGTWFNYSKKWFTKEDPLEISITDKSLAEAFEE